MCAAARRVSPGRLTQLGATTHRARRRRSRRGVAPIGCAHAGKSVCACPQQATDPRRPPRRCPRAAGGFGPARLQCRRTRNPASRSGRASPAPCASRTARATPCRRAAPQLQALEARSSTARGEALQFGHAPGGNQRTFGGRTPKFHQQNAAGVQTPASSVRQVLEGALLEAFCFNLPTTSNLPHAY